MAKLKRKMKITKESKSKYRANIKKKIKIMDQKMKLKTN